MNQTEIPKVVSEKIINGLKIDPQIFTFNFNCKCNGQCCNYGVYTDLKEYELILSLKDKLIPLMDDSQTTDVSKWFESPEEDSDFSSGIAVGTELHNGKCVFLNKEGLCIIQKLAISENKFKWEYKPLYCILFPLTIFEHSLTIDNEHIDRLPHCNKNNSEKFTIFEYCKEELLHLLGNAGYNELVDYHKEFLLKKEII